MAALEHEVPTRRSDWSTSEVRRVVIRLTDGDVIQAGTAANLDGAKTLVHDLIREIEQPGGRVAADRRSSDQPGCRRLGRRAPRQPRSR